MLIELNSNITWALPKIDFRVWRPHKNKIINKQVTKGHVCNSAHRMSQGFKPTIWKDDMIFRVNTNNNTNECVFIISSPIVRRPKAF
jgi:hypothetical protein